MKPMVVCDGWTEPKHPRIVLSIGDPTRVSHGMCATCEQAMAVEPRTHFVEFDAPRLGRHKRALCGELVDAANHRPTPAPTCPECLKRMREDEESIELLRQLPPNEEDIHAASQDDDRRPDDLDDCRR